MRTKSSKKSGISLIVLVITIIVIIILAVAVILSIANNNPIENANKAKFQNDLKTIAEELTLKESSNYIDKHTGKTTSDVTINSLSSATKYIEKLRVDNGVLYYNDAKLSAKEKEWAEEVGITDGAYVIGKAEDKGKTVDGVTISDDGKTLSGKYTGTNKNIKVAEGVTTIKGFFEDGAIPEALFKDAESIVLPSTLTRINEYSFMNNKNITSINIPDSVTYIGTSAFAGCNNLEVVLPLSVKNIWYSALNNVKSVTLPNNNGETFNMEWFKYNWDNNAELYMVNKVYVHSTQLKKDELDITNYIHKKLLNAINNNQLVILDD